jgi:hypothetical protein
MTTSIEITVFWDVMPAFCQINISVLEKPAAFSVMENILIMEASGLSPKLVYCYQTAQHHISHHFSMRIMYSPSARQLRCTVLPAGFITAWDVMFGFVKCGPI